MQRESSNISIGDLVSRIQSQIPVYPRAMTQSIMEMVDSVRLQLRGDSSFTLDSLSTEDSSITGLNRESSVCDNNLEIIEMMGEGAFGKVFRGLWRGTPVAVKTMVLFGDLHGQEKRERMAIMEAAISTSLSHPNIVQVSRGVHLLCRVPRC